MYDALSFDALLLKQHERPCFLERVDSASLSSFERAVLGYDGTVSRLLALTANEPVELLKPEDTPRQADVIAVDRVDPLIGILQELGSGQIVYNYEISCEQCPWLADHRVFDRVVVSAALHLAAALSSRSGPRRVSDVIVTRPLVLDGEPSNRQLNQQPKQKQAALRAD
jgi:Polyketide synthase dehydratase domain